MISNILFCSISCNSKVNYQYIVIYILYAFTSRFMVGHYRPVPLTARHISLSPSLFVCCKLIYETTSSYFKRSS